MRREIANNVFLTEVAGNYKRNRLSIYTASLLERGNLTSTAMLPFLLERGTAQLPDMTLLKRKQQELYGAILSTGYSTSRFSRVVEGYIEGVDSRLIEDGVAIQAARLGLLTDVLLDPHTENGAFPERWVDIEREKLRETIRSIINEKRDFCMKLLLEAFFSGDERALPIDGFEEDLDVITGQSLFRDYGAFFNRASLEVLYVGAKIPDLESTVLRALQGRTFDAAVPRALFSVPKTDEQRIVREMDVEQDKLAMAFTPGRVLSDREMTTLRLASALYGGAPTSRLFVNVREKQSLCYYINSQPSYRNGGGIVVECGINPGKAEQAKSSILKELDTLCAEGPTAQEMEQIKLFFESILHGLSDSSASLSHYYYGKIVNYKRIVTPQQEMAEIRSITRDEVVDLLGLLHLNTSCLICKKEGK